MNCSCLAYSGRNSKVLRIFDRGVYHNVQLIRTLCRAFPATESPRADIKDALEKEKSKKAKIKKFDMNFNDNQSKEILKILNSRSFEELSKTKHIGKSRASNLKKHEAEHGSLTDLNQLMNVNGFGKSFFAWLEKNPTLPFAKPKDNWQEHQLDIVFSGEQQKNITSIVSIDVGMVNSAWTHMDRNHVIAWNRSNITKTKPYNPVILKPKVQAFVDSLPAADAYVVEMQPARIVQPLTASGYAMPLPMQLVIEGMLYCLIKGPVYPMKPRHVSTHFGLAKNTLGKKKAAVSLVSSLFNTNTDEEGENSISDSRKLNIQTQQENVLDLGRGFTVSDELVEYFKSNYKQDDLSDSLLQGLAFFDLLDSR